MVPQPREIWIVIDEEIKLHSEKREPKRGRPVLILSSHELTKNEAQIINIIPLTTSSEFDTLIYPIARAYDKCYDGFQPDPNSAALIQFYQPIRIKYFKKRCGLISTDAYEAIQHTLCVCVIGISDYNIEIPIG